MGVSHDFCRSLDGKSTSTRKCFGTRGFPLRVDESYRRKCWKSFIWCGAKRAKLWLISCARLSGLQCFRNARIEVTI
jgi:hypothetical protein